MLLSIIIPTYNSSGFIGETISAIERYVVANSEYNFELVIVDDGSLDGTYEKLKEIAEKKQGENLLPHIIEAVKAYATTGEVLGTVRMAFGYGYDPFEVLEHPFFS